MLQLQGRSCCVAPRIKQLCRKFAITPTAAPPTERSRQRRPRQSPRGRRATGSRRKSEASRSEPSDPCEPSWRSGLRRCTCDGSLQGVHPVASPDYESRMPLVTSQNKGAMIRFCRYGYRSIRPVGIRHPKHGGVDLTGPMRTGRVARVRAGFGRATLAKRVLSLANGVVGVMHAAALAVHFIGEGLAIAEGLDPKHAIKQVDRLLSNPAISGVVVLFRAGCRSWRPRERLCESLLTGPTSSRDDQTTIALYLLTSHGRATPLVWKTVKKSELKERRGRYYER